MLYLVGYIHRATRKTADSDLVPISARLAMQRIRKKVCTPSAHFIGPQEKIALGLGWRNCLTNQL